MATIDQQAINQLIERLRAAGLSKPSDDADETTNARAPVTAALEATIEFLRDVGVPEDSRAPLFHLLAALADADSGLSNPITTKAPYVEGTPKTPIHKQAERSVGRF